MKEELALRLLSQIMEWDDERSRKEFAWLNIMSRYKYDDYQDYLAGARFTESLLKWLQQFEQGHRETAYTFVRRHLVYVGGDGIAASGRSHVFRNDHKTTRRLRGYAA